MTKKMDSKWLSLATTAMDGGSAGFAGATNRSASILGQAPQNNPLFPASGPLTIDQALSLASARLSDVSDGMPRLEAEVLLAFTLEQPRTHLFAWPEKNLTPRQGSDFESLLTRRIQGEPTAYLTGRKEFWSMQFRVTPETLIPRPETEQLVERALHRVPSDAPWQIADLGTGCGVIAAAIASERPLSEIIATDISVQALAVAENNFRHLGLANIRCAPGTWCAALPRGKSFDLIVSNPPYIAAGDPHLNRGSLPWEPAPALAAGKDGLDDIRRIIDQAIDHLKADGWLLLEHGWDQGTQVRALLTQAGYRENRTRQDLAHRERVSEGRRAV